MTDDFDETGDAMPGDGLAELVRLVGDALADVEEKARRLDAAFGAIAPEGPGQPDPAGPAPAADQPDATAAENLQANRQAARALEELVRHGLRLRDPPPAVYGP